MGVTGKGLRADGLHKTFMNGSQEDHASAAAKTRTGGGTSLSNAHGLNKQFGNHLPQEGGTPGKSPSSMTHGSTKRINATKGGN